MLAPPELETHKTHDADSDDEAEDYQGGTKLYNGCQTGVLGHVAGGAERLKTTQHRRGKIHGDTEDNEGDAGDQGSLEHRTHFWPCLLSLIVSCEKLSTP